MGRSVGIVAEALARSVDVDLGGVEAVQFCIQEYPPVELAMGADPHTTYTAF